MNVTMKETKPNRFLKLQYCPNSTDLHWKDAKLYRNRFACNRYIHFVKKGNKYNKGKNKKDTNYEREKQRPTTEKTKRFLRLHQELNFPLSYIPVPADRKMPGLNGVKIPRLSLILNVSYAGLHKC